MICIICNKEYLWNHNSKYCSIECREKWRLKSWKVKSNRISSYNIAFNNKLLDLWYKTQLEKTLKFWWVTRDYDICFWNILIEINPTHSHNSTNTPYWGEPKEKDYHKIKTKIALENGFRCIHQFERTSDDDVLNLINQTLDLTLPVMRIDMSTDNYMQLLENWYKLVERSPPQEHICLWNKRKVSVYDSWIGTFIKIKS